MSKGGFAKIILISLVVALVGVVGYLTLIPPQTACDPSTPPSITVVSPNGGEVYSAGQQITIEWESCNVNQLVGATLSGFPYPSSTQFFVGNWVAANTGSQVVTIPSTAPPGNYVINISTPPESSPGVDDWSDNFFQITP